MSNHQKVNPRAGVGKTTLALYLAGQWAGKERQQGVLDFARGTLHREVTEIAGADRVLIDGRLRLAAQMRSTLLVADLVIFPAQPSPFDGWAAGQTMRRASEAHIFRPQRVARFVLNRCTFRSVITRQRVVFPDAARTARLVCEVPHGMAAADEIAARQFPAEAGGGA
jgi:chromosome partitioning protein